MYALTPSAKVGTPEKDQRGGEREGRERRERERERGREGEREVVVNKKAGTPSCTCICTASHFSVCLCLLAIWRLQNIEEISWGDGQLWCVDLQQSSGSEVREEVVIDPTNEDELEGSRGTANFTMKVRDK